MSEEFSALVLNQTDGCVSSEIKRLSVADLPDAEVLVRIDYSTLNYKDGLILNGLGKLVRAYPHVPGIDFAGTVEQSADARYKPGDQVILTGWRVGEVWWGGYAQKARVRGDWLVPMPKGLDTKRAMAIGTAGLTSMLAVIALEKHGLVPDGGEVLVTGAAGGVGSTAVAILAKLGYRVAAATGRASTHGFLRDLGAASFVERSEIADAPARPLMSERWAAAIDAVGGKTLANVLAQLKLHGSVASIGNAAGIEMTGTVLPFILRGVNLLGIDSAQATYESRVEAWGRLVRDLPFDKLDAMTSVHPLAALPDLGARIIKGDVQGRVVVDVNA